MIQKICGFKKNCTIHVRRTVRNFRKQILGRLVIVKDKALSTIEYGSVMALILYIIHIGLIEMMLIAITDASG